ncbi:MAG: DUF1835 domain-containing protein [Candidatus Thiodiazotropha sp.]|jgi:hypothetical protein
MSEYKPSAAKPRILSEVAKQRQIIHHQKALALLNAYRAGDPEAVKEFREHCIGGNEPDFEATLLKARMLVSGGTTVVHRLSLEKLKKEAKDLIKQFKASAPEAIGRFKQHHPRFAGKLEFKLADAQLVIARENCLPTWPKLKAHIEAMNLATKQAENKTASPDADMKTLHIRCGNDIKEPLKHCGFKGDFLEISNPFVQGPVPHFDPLDEFVAIRSAFIHRDLADLVPAKYAHLVEKTDEDLHHQENTLRTLTKNYQRVVLWFEHDPYDQLCKSYVLAHLAELNLSNTVVECIQINSFPGVKKFIGIGQLSQAMESMLVLWPQRTPITAKDIAYGARCWQALINNNPTTLCRLTQEKTPQPLMRNAFQRFLKELPWEENGLGLTEQLALNIISEEGPLRPGAIFNLLMTECEPLPYLGDIMLVSALRPLWQAQNSAISVVDTYPEEAHPMRQTRLAITDTGLALLNGECDWLKINPVAERWIGGVHARHGQQNWYWSESKGKPVLSNNANQGEIVIHA